MENKSHNGQEMDRPLELANKQDFLTIANKKTEKIVAALYLVTTILSDNDPLKWELRERATRLLELVAKVSSRTYATSPQLVDEVVELGREITSLLEVARIAQIISDMNCRVVSEEIDRFLEQLSASSAHLNALTESIFSQDFFWGSVAGGSKEGSKEDEVVFRRPTTPVSHKKQPISGVVTQYKGQAPVSPKKQPEVSGDHSKNDRKATILKLAGEHEFLSVKDVAFVVKNCSEKTIQRELLAMVGEGLLKKEGERRWSKYSLVVRP